jgi:putative ABC transport system substrate-binding protein
MIREVQDAAGAKRVHLRIVKAGSEAEIEAAFATLVELHAGALVIGADPLFYSRREQIVKLAGRHAIPAMYEWREFVATGGLVSYGTSLAGAWRQVGVYAERSSRGPSQLICPSCGRPNSSWL